MRATVRLYISSTRVVSCTCREGVKSEQMWQTQHVHLGADDLIAHLKCEGGHAHVCTRSIYMCTYAYASVH